MSRVLTNTYRKHNTAPSKFTAWIFLLLTIYAIFHGVSGLEKLENLSNFDFNWYVGCTLGGTVLLVMQIICWLRDY